jgi:hypothetical protein
VVVGGVAGWARVASAGITLHAVLNNKPSINLARCILRLLLRGDVVHVQAVFHGQCQHLDLHSQ